MTYGVEKTNYFMRMFSKKRRRPQKKVDYTFNKCSVPKLPKDWMVYELAQSPVHFLWYCTAIKMFDEQDKKDGITQIVQVEGYDTPTGAVKECLRLIRAGNIQRVKNG